MYQFSCSVDNSLPTLFHAHIHMHMHACTHPHTIHNTHTHMYTPTRTQHTNTRTCAHTQYTHTHTHTHTHTNTHTQTRYRPAELNVWQKMDCPNIIPLYGVVLDGHNTYKCFQLMPKMTSTSARSNTQSYWFKYN